MSSVTHNRPRRPAMWATELILAVAIIAISGFGLASQQLPWHEIVTSLFARG